MPSFYTHDLLYVSLYYWNTDDST